jgi:hypothetical protein
VASKEQPILEQSSEDRLKLYSSLPKLGGDPQNTGESVTSMVNRLEAFAASTTFVSVLNIKAAE